MVRLHNSTDAQHNNHRCSRKHRHNHGHDTDALTCTQIVSHRLHYAQSTALRAHSGTNKHAEMRIAAHKHANTVHEHKRVNAYTCNRIFRVA
jgi:hypothetical protein